MHGSPGGVKGCICVVRGYAGSIVRNGEGVVVILSSSDNVASPALKTDPSCVLLRLLLRLCSAVASALGLRSELTHGRRGRLLFAGLALDSALESGIAGKPSPGSGGRARLLLLVLLLLRLL